MSDLVATGVNVVDVAVASDVTLEPPLKLNFVNVFDPVMPIPPNMEVGFDVSRSAAF